MKLHALVDDIETGRAAVEGGATVVQLRVKATSTDEVVERGRVLRRLCNDAGVTFVVNDDVEAALRLRADGVHLGGDDPGADEAVAKGLLLGLSADTAEEAVAAASRSASYVGAGPVWATPTKPDAGAPLGVAGLAAICAASPIPVVAIGGIDARNAADCIHAGAAGVAVVRAARDAAAIRQAIDEALATR